MLVLGSRTERSILIGDKIALKVMGVVNKTVAHMAAFAEGEQITYGSSSALGILNFDALLPEILEMKSPWLSIGSKIRVAFAQREANFPEGVKMGIDAPRSLKILREKHVTEDMSNLKALLARLELELAQ